MRNWEADGVDFFTKKSSKSRRNKMTVVDGNNGSVEKAITAGLHNGVSGGSSAGDLGDQRITVEPQPTATFLVDEVDGDLGIRSQLLEPPIIPVPAIVFPKSGDIADAYIGEPGPECTDFIIEIEQPIESGTIDYGNSGVYPKHGMPTLWEKAMTVVNKVYEGATNASTAVTNTAIMPNLADLKLINNEAGAANGTRCKSIRQLALLFSRETNLLLLVPSIDKDCYNNPFDTFGITGNKNLVTKPVVSEEIKSAAVAPLTAVRVQEPEFISPKPFRNSWFAASISMSIGTAFMKVLSACLAFITCCFLFKRKSTKAIADVIEMEEVVIGPDVVIDMCDKVNWDYIRRQTWYQQQALLLELESSAAFISVSPTSNKIHGLLPAVATLPQRNYAAEARVVKRVSKVTYATAPFTKSPKVVEKDPLPPSYSFVFEGLKESEKSGKSDITINNLTTTPTVKSPDTTNAKPIAALIKKIRGPTPISKASISYPSPFSPSSLSSSFSPPLSSPPPSLTSSKNPPTYDSSNRSAFCKVTKAIKFLATPTRNSPGVPEIIITPPSEPHNYSIGIPVELCLHNVMRNGLNEEENIIYDIYDLIHLLHPISIDVIAKADGFYKINKFDSNYKDRYSFIGGHTIHESRIIAKLFSRRFCYEDLLRIIIFGEEYGRYGEETVEEDDSCLYKVENPEEFQGGNDDFVDWTAFIDKVDQEITSWMAVSEGSASGSQSTYADTASLSSSNTLTAANSLPPSSYTSPINTPWTRDEQQAWFKRSAELEELIDWFFQDHNT